MNEPHRTLSMTIPDGFHEGTPITIEAGHWEGFFFMYAQLRKNDDFAPFFHALEFGAEDISTNVQRVDTTLYVEIESTLLLPTAHPLVCFPFFLSVARRPPYLLRYDEYQNPFALRHDGLQDYEAEWLFGEYEKFAIELLTFTEGLEHAQRQKYQGRGTMQEFLRLAEAIKISMVKLMVHPERETFVGQHKAFHIASRIDKNQERHYSLYQRHHA